MNAVNPIRGSTSYQALIALPDNLVGELIGGELHTQPRLATPRAMAGFAHDHDSGSATDEASGIGNDWWIVPEPEIHFVRDTEVVVPDLGGWRRARLSAIPATHRFEVVPDWVCEILSPSTVKKDRILKLPLYARYGVSYVWLLDPQARTLEAFSLRQGCWNLIASHKDDDSACIAPFAAMSFSMAELWR